jgi:23S rRNA pseudouridine955/2504/2580 synthase
MPLHEVQQIAVAAADDGVRLDRWLRRRWPELGQTQIHKLARSGQLRVDGGRAKAETRLAAGAVVRIPPFAGTGPANRVESLSPVDKAFAKGLVLYEDAEVLVLNKPAGLAVQGGTKTTRHIDRLLGAWGEGLARPRLVHRLDRDTSGVLALGKSAASAAKLAAAFAERDTNKTYWAIVHGLPAEARGRIDLPLAKLGVDDREKMVPVDRADPAGLRAASDYVVLARAGEAAAWLALRPITGRTHQLRAHALAIGHPILGDPKYHTAASLAASGDLKLQLHARRLVIPHPTRGVVDVEAPISPELRAGFTRFGFDDTTAPNDPFGWTA